MAGGGIGQFSLQAHSEEMKRMQKITKGDLPGIVSTQLTRDDIDALESSAKEKRKKKYGGEEAVANYIEAIFANAAYRDAVNATRARKAVRTQALQGRYAAIFTRGLKPLAAGK